MYDLFVAARELGLSGLGMKMSYEELLEIDCPGIARVDKKHFVLVDPLRTEDQKVRILDGFNEPYWTDKENFTKRWNREIMLISIPTAPLPQGQEAGSPCILFEDMVHDFGTLQEGEIAEWAFFFANMGEITINILEVSASCGCTAASSTSKEILPGATGEIAVAFDTLGKVGHQSYTITVLTSDSSQPKISLEVLAIVKTDVLVEPRRVSFGAVKRTELPKQDIIITDTGQGKLEIAEVQSSSEHIKTAVAREIRVSEDGSDAPRFVLSVQLNPEGLPTGDFKETLTVHLLNSKRPDLTLPVRANILGDFIVSPKSFFFGFVDPSEPVVRKVTLQSTNGKPLKVSKVETELPLHIRIGDLPDGNLTLEATFNATSDSQGWCNGYVSVYAEDTIVQVPVMAMVSSKK